MCTQSDSFHTWHCCIIVARIIITVVIIYSRTLRGSLSWIILRRAFGLRQFWLRWLRDVLLARIAVVYIRVLLVGVDDVRGSGGHGVLVAVVAVTEAPLYSLSVHDLPTTALVIIADATLHPAVKTATERLWSNVTIKALNNARHYSILAYKKLVIMGHNAADWSGLPTRS